MRRFRQQHSLWVAIWQDSAHSDVRIAEAVESPLHERHRQLNSANDTAKDRKAALYGGMDALLDGRRVLTAIARGLAVEDGASAGYCTAGADYRVHLTAFFPTKCIQVAPWDSRLESSCTCLRLASSIHSWPSSGCSHTYSCYCTLILYAVELIINCHLLDIGTGQTGGKLKIDGDMTLML